MRTTSVAITWAFLGLVACQSAPRITFVDRAVSLVGTDALVSGVDGFELRHFATVAPPRTSRGEIVQAAGFDSDGLGRYYVAYNSMGDASYGALEVLSGSASTEGDLRVVASRVFDDYEFAAVRKRGDDLVAVGAKGGMGAVLVVARVSGDRIEVRGEALLAPAFYATALTLEGDLAYVSTGDNDGVRRVDLSRPDAPTVVGFTPLSNATWVSRAFGTTLALGGDTETGLYRERGGAFALSMPVAPRVLAAPSRMARVDDLGALNGDGLAVVRFGSDFAQSGAAVVLGRRALEGTSNGISIDGARRVYAAQGEAGLFVFDVCDPSRPAQLGRVDFPNDSGSANDVHYAEANSVDQGHEVRRVLLLADGLGGFKVLTLTLSPTARASLEARRGGEDGDGDGRLSVSSPGRYRVPEGIDAVDGDVEGRVASLSFDGVTCSYRGRASAGASARFEFEACENGAHPGDSLAVSCRVLLRLDPSSPAGARARCELDREDG